MGVILATFCVLNARMLEAVFGEIHTQIMNQVERRLLDLFHFSLNLTVLT